jgi:DNA-binding transcriptional regulator YhcF (GntR family)
MVYRSMSEDIAEHYKQGDRYLSVRIAAEKFGVSLQTAQSAVSALREEGILETRKKSGVFVRNKPGSIDPSGKKIILLSGINDPRFITAFQDSIREVVEPLGMEVIYVNDTCRERNTIQYGEYLISLYAENNASGIIALAYRDAELAFYHAMNSGCLIVSDVSFPNLPMLPSIQTDNHKHSREAAQRFARLGKKNVVIVGYWKKGNVRHRTFEEEFRTLVSDAEIKYVFLGEETAPADLYIFIKNFNLQKCVFSIDYAANHTVASHFITYNLSPRNNFLVYDSERDFFLHPGLEPVETAAPGLNVLGRKLSEKLLARIVTGTWPDPLQELL